MKTTFRKSFQRDLKKLKKNRQILARIRREITDVEAAGDLHDLSSVKKLSGEESYYRIRVGNYRIGIKQENDRIAFICCLHRRDIYRYFP